MTTTNIRRLRRFNFHHQDTKTPRKDQEEGRRNGPETGDRRSGGIVSSKQRAVRGKTRGQNFFDAINMIYRIMFYYRGTEITEVELAERATPLLLDSARPILERNRIFLR